jgi:hypothetical protein
MCCSDGIAGLDWLRDVLDDLVLGAQMSSLISIPAGAPTLLVCGHTIGFNLLFWTSRRTRFVSTIPSSGRGRMLHIGICCTRRT